MIGYRFTIKMNGEFVTLTGEGFFRRDAADRALAQHLKNCQWKRPRWWQFRRWREDRPRKEVLRYLRERDV